MAAPSITITDASNRTITNWDAGEVQSSKQSAVLTCKIWNNRGGNTSLSDLRDVSITVLDMDNKATSDVVTDHWLGVKCLGEDDFTRVGGTVVKQFRADGLTVTDGYVIQGSANNGVEVDSQANVATVDLSFFVPENVTAGTRDVKIRIMGIYT